MKTLIRTAAAAALLAAVTACTSAPEGRPALPKVDLGAVRLVSYSGCDELLTGLREHAAENTGPWGFGNAPIMYTMEARSDARAEAKSTTSTPEHSTTNVHEAGVDEPDLVKTDGNRVLTVAGGTLRVIDTASRKVTGSLKLTKDGEATFVPADLLVSGDRALVMFRGGGDVMVKSFAPLGDTRYVLVDLAGEPKVLATVKPQGTYVDARMVGSTVRLVTRAQPDITLPQPGPDDTEAKRTSANRAAVRKAPLSAWLPTVEITDASGRTRKDTMKCERVSHPADYTGTSLLAVHTIDLARGLDAAGTDPIGVAADGDTVYGTGTSLYVSSNPRWWWPMPIEDAVAPADEPTPPEPTPGEPDPVEPDPSAKPSLSEEPVPSPTPPAEETEIHRFDISKPGAPAYVASGKVPGRLLNQYALSEYDGHLRVATTLASADGKDSSSSVYVLKSDTLAKVGEVGGLGRGERIYSVRFAGPVGYCVTFRQVDPLYTLDLRDPAAPKVTGELKITGYSAYLHPVGEGRLIGIGQEASAKGRTLGTQVSLFDVSDPAAPRRLAQMFQKDSGSEAEWDPHAFLYWPKTGLAVLPMYAWGANGDEVGAVALRVSESGVERLGMIKHPRRTQEGGVYQPGIQRSMVIGDEIWTLSYDGIQVNDLATLKSKAWIPLT
uniref:beta-propeller domain-containing protein n=1 Tax=Nonomuraea pusilla TaxID=46177 RepID=UPI0006E14EF2|nr:beta-propeller domain-containing protein [Nonomuraea pusilla]